MLNPLNPPTILQANQACRLQRRRLRKLNIFKLPTEIFSLNGESKSSHSTVNAIGENTNMKDIMVRDYWPEGSMQTRQTSKSLDRQSVNNFPLQSSLL
jgi:hypothetical protein